MSRAYWSEPFRHAGVTQERYTLLVPGVRGEARPYHAGTAYKKEGEWRISGHSYVLEPDAPRYIDREYARMAILNDRLREIGDEIELLRREQSAIIAAMAEEGEL